MNSVPAQELRSPTLSYGSAAGVHVPVALMWLACVAGGAVTCWAVSGRIDDAIHWFYSRGATDVLFSDFDDELAGANVKWVRIIDDEMVGDFITAPTFMPAGFTRFHVVMPLGSGMDASLIAWLERSPGRPPVLLTTIIPWVVPVQLIVFLIVAGVPGLWVRRLQSRRNARR